MVAAGPFMSCERINAILCVPTAYIRSLAMQDARRCPPMENQFCADGSGPNRLDTWSWAPARRLLCVRGLMSSSPHAMGRPPSLLSANTTARRALICWGSYGTRAYSPYCSRCRHPACANRLVVLGPTRHYNVTLHSRCGLHVPEYGDFWTDYSIDCMRLH